MAGSEPAFTLGIEEEYLLVDKESRDLVSEAPDGLMEACSDALKEQVSPEFLQCQIEVGTRVCKTIAEAREELIHLRSTIADVARNFGLAPIAASTHPFAKWADQHHTHKERYDTLVRDLGGVAHRMLICGMHVHVGIDDEDMRIDIHNQLAYFLPHLLALSTSSPFWQGRDMQLKSYRLVVFDALPRTGLPQQFVSFGEYARTVNVLVQAGLIEDASKIWWDLRPSVRFPTLEMRVCDVPTRLNDTVSIAALYVCLARMLYRLRCNNQRWRQYPKFLIDENRWRAKRYGLEEGLIDFGLGSIVPFADLMEELIEMVREEAQATDCLAEVEHVREIVKNGTSADRQRRVYTDAISAGAEPHEALKAVVDMLIEETTA
ncbi:MAG: carboxylate-amine ligase [Hyphomicrobiales bacterium]|nr:carboxylate-amine ligase [Hyphomicrobiales bacterium]MCP5073556.1 carboxylate-amine ligase [Paracoccaceae bacterium]